MIAWAILGVLAFNRKDSLMSLIEGGWFVNCIMIYYVPVFFIKKYYPNKVDRCIVAYTFVFIIIYMIWDKPVGFNILKDPYLKWWFLFFIMLLGAYLGKRSETITAAKGDKLFFLIALIGFHLFAYAKKYLFDIQVLIVPALMGICYYGYKILNISSILTFYNNHKIIKGGIRFLGGLCLEIYLVNISLISDKLNYLFPLNVLIILAEIIVVAYVVRCLSKFILQTFSKDDYSWNEIFKFI